MIVQLSMQAVSGCVLACLSVSVLSDNAKYIAADSEALEYGRTIWLQNCESCHGYGIAEAPIPMQPEDWSHRVIKHRTTLYTHAIDGFIGPEYSMMPARGGNDALTDEEVKAAVDYMLHLVNYYIKQRGDL